MHQVFGNPRIEEQTIYTAVIVNMNPADLVLTHRDGLCVGWPALTHTDSMGTKDSPVVIGLANRKGSSLSLGRLNTRTTDMVSEVDAMLDDLIGIVRREKTVVFRRQAEFLREELSVGVEGRRTIRVPRKDWGEVDIRTYGE